MLVYIIAAYQSAERVRRLHRTLRAAGHTPTSRWAESAHGPEQLGDADACERARRANLDDMHRAQAVIVLADTPMREGWCEVERCRHTADVLVVGRHNLTTRARCYAQVPDDGRWIDEALDWLREVDALIAGGEGAGGEG